jgi:RNA polymerase sigma factor (sigma-70 family)
MKQEIPIDAVAKRIFRFAVGKTDNVQDAEDLAQEILLSLVRSAEKLPGVENFDAWLTRICTYSWSNYYRRENRHWRTVDDKDFDQIHGRWKADDFVEQGEHDRIVSTVQEHVGFLNSTYREVIVRRYYENESMTEIAEALRMQPGTVKWYLHEAKRKLKEHIMNESKIDCDTEQRYRPVRLGIGHSGRPGKTGEPNTVLESLLAQNIIYAAYRKPLTADQIARNLGVGAPFIEDALKKLEYSDLVVKRKNTYQSSLFIIDFEIERRHIDYFITFAAKIADPLHSAARSAISDVRSVGFLGSELDDDLLLWNLLPYYLLRLAERTDERKRYCDISAPERNDGGKYIALAFLQEEFERAKSDKNPELEVFKRYECCGIKTRYDMKRTASLQIDSFFAGATWRDFDLTDLQKLDRVAELVRSGEEPNDLDRVYIADYVSKGYLCSDDGHITFRFPCMTVEEKHRVDEIIYSAFEDIDGVKYFEGIIDAQYRYWKSAVPDTLSDVEIKVKALNASGDAMLGCLEWLERNGRLRTPTEDEKAALSTFMYGFEKTDDN